MSLKAVLISTYELGRQPFGLASPAAWLRETGADVTCADVSRAQLPEDAVREADLVAFYVPMHTATRLAVTLLPLIRELNPPAHVCFYGLYAPVNEAYLRGLGVDTILGGEFEESLTALGRCLSSSLKDTDGQADAKLIRARCDDGKDPLARAQARVELGPRQLGDEPRHAVSLARQRFRLPHRVGLPPLDKYARLILPESGSRTVGYTEASRGCKHLCRHCPIVPVYNGVFRIVDRDVVLADVRQQVDAGAQHVTFGDPDFFNGIGHAIPLIEELHREFPQVTYDVTIKIEHLLKHQDALPKLRDTGCLFVTSAVESVDDEVLLKLAKNHTRADFLRVVRVFREMSLTLAPTFVAFTPWTTLAGFCDLLEVICDNGLVENVAPIQFAIRLLIPAGSLLLELPDIREIVGSFDEENLVYPWKHADPRVDELCQRLQDIVHAGEKMSRTRGRIFERIEEAAFEALGDGGTEAKKRRAMPVLPARATIPYLNEPWYC